MSRIDEIRAREASATKGPWKFDGCDISAPDGTCVVYDELFEGDTDFIAHARADIPYLLARLDAAEKALREIRDSDHQQYDITRVGEYQTGIADGHRCAAKIARAYFAEQEKS